MTLRAPFSDAPAPRRSGPTIEFDIKPTCAELRCEFAFSGVPLALSPKQGSAFLVGPELVATAAHLLDITSDIAAPIHASGTASTPGTPPTNALGNWVQLRVLVLPIGQQWVYCLLDEPIVPKLPIYQIKPAAGLALYVSEKVLTALRGKVTRTITLKFSDLGRIERRLVIPAERFHDDPVAALFQETAPVPASPTPVPLSPTVPRSKEVAPATIGHEEDVLEPLKAEGFCAYEHDCAVLQFDADAVIWDWTPVPLGAGVVRDEVVYLFGYPGVMQQSCTMLKGELREVHASTTTPLSDSHRLALRFDEAGPLSNPLGFSGGPVIAEDGTCIGIQSAIIPTPLGSGLTGPQFERYFCVPILYLQRLLPFRLELQYRPNVYPASTRALHQRRQVLTPIILGHPSFHRHYDALATTLESFDELGPYKVDHQFLRDSVQVLEQYEDRRHELSNLINHANVILVVVGWDDHNGSRNKQFLHLIQAAQNAAERNNALVMYCLLSERSAHTIQIDSFAFDVSEIFSATTLSKMANRRTKVAPGSIGANSEYFAIWVSIIYRIHLLLDSINEPVH